MSPEDQSAGAATVATATPSGLWHPPAAEVLPAVPTEGADPALLVTLERAARLTLLESAIRRVEGRPWAAHHAERRFLRRLWRWLPAEDRQRPEAHTLASAGRRMVRAHLAAEARAGVRGRGGEIA